MLKPVAINADAPLAISDPPPGEVAKEEATKLMTVPLSLRDAPTVRQRKVSDTHPSCIKS